MSTDFNIKPVGAPVASPVVSPTSDTTQKAVATDLPPSQTVTPPEPSVRVTIGQDAAKAPVGQPQSEATDRVIIDRDAGTVVYQMVDSRTNLVVRQYPEQAALRRRAYFNTLDLNKEAATRAPATDRQV